MARLNVNPTRMELRRLKDRLKTAVKGYKLLKDKSDEMVRQFMVMVRENKRLRRETETELAAALRAFMLARASDSEANIEQAIAMPSYRVDMECSSRSVMGVDVPSVKIKPSEDNVLLPYSLTSVTAELDTGITRLNRLIAKLLQLAQVEKACNMLACEIARNRRRVNALEYVVIPDCEETIKYIMMKLDENERSSQVRLMKVKSGFES